MKIYHILLVLTGLILVTFITHTPSAQAEDTTVQKTSQLEQHVETLFFENPTATTDAPVPLHTSTQHYPVTNVVSLIETGFHQLESTEGTQAAQNAAALPFNQGMLLLGHGGYISGHDTLMILHTNAQHALEERFTGFLIQNNRVIPSRISIHSNLEKLRRAQSLYGNKAY